MPVELPSHVQWLLEHHGQAIEAALQAQDVGLDAAGALAAMMAVDPSPGHHAVQWLSTTLISGGVRWEDMAAGAGSRAAETLSWFAQARATLPRPARNLAAYQSLGAVYAAVAPMVEAARREEMPSAGSRALRRAARAAAIEQSIVLCRRPDLVVAVPLTRAASCWWGLGTQWCTAARANNMFAHYHARAPLIVVVLPGVALQSPGVGLQSEGIADLQSEGIADLQSTGIAGGKLQLHMEPHWSGGVQFMDVHDSAVSPGFIHEHWAVLQPLVEWAVGVNGHIIEHMDWRTLSPELCLRAVTSRGAALHHVPQSMRTEEVYRACVVSDPGMLYVVPDDMMTHRLLSAMVSAHPMALENVPQHLRTPELCWQAVGLDGRTLQGVAREQRNAQLCGRAVANNGLALEYVPGKNASARLCRQAVQGVGAALEHVPAHMQSRELCVIAAHGGYLLGHYSIALHELDEEDYLAAVGARGDNLRHVPYHLRTSLVCTMAVQTCPRAIKHVPEHLYTHEMAMDCVARDAIAILGVAQDKRTRDMYALATQGNPDVFAYVPTQYMTADMCTMAVRHKSANIAHVPRRLISTQLWTLVCLDDPRCIRIVPPRFQSPVKAALEGAMANPRELDNTLVPHDWDEATYFDGLVEMLEQAYSGPRLGQETRCCVTPFAAGPGA